MKFVISLISIVFGVIAAQADTYLYIEKTTLNMIAYKQKVQSASGYFICKYRVENVFGFPLSVGETNSREELVIDFKIQQSQPNKDGYSQVQLSTDQYYQAHLDTPESTPGFLVPSPERVVVTGCDFKFQIVSEVYGPGQAPKKMKTTDYPPAVLSAGIGGNVTRVLQESLNANVLMPGLTGLYFKKR